MKRVVYAVLCLIANRLFKLLFRLKTRGTENIPLRGAVVIASNHLSFLDPPVLGSVLPRPAYYMARHELFSFPIWGGFLRFINVFPVHRSGFDRNAIKYAIDLLRQGKAIILFPEGTRSASGALLPALPGIGMIAWEGNAAVVPVYIKGTNYALPPKAKYIRAHRIEVTFGKPFLPRRLFSGELPHRELYPMISNYIMSEIDKLKSKFS